VVQQSTSMMPVNGDGPVAASCDSRKRSAKAGTE
jgi:hypothetical protein